MIGWILREKAHKTLAETLCLASSDRLFPDVIICQTLLTENVVYSC